LTAIGRERKWKILAVPGAAASAMGVAATDGSRPAVLLDSAGASATIVACVASQLNAAVETLDAVMPPDGSNMHLIALLFVDNAREEASGVSAMRKAALVAQRELLIAGVDDVVVGSIETDIVLAVDLAVVRTEANRAAVMEMKQAMLDHLESELRIRTEELEAAHQETLDSLFWQSVHKTFRNFPEIDPNISPKIEAGSYIGPYMLTKRLGRGGFGQVYNAEHTDTGEREAIKVLDKRQFTKLKDVSDLWREMMLLQSFDHANIVKLTDCGHGPRHIFICMELAGIGHLGQEIRRHRGRIDMDTTMDYQRQLCTALSYISAKAVAHRDVKPENIAVSADKCTIKLLDFGSCAQLGKACADMAGTMPLMAPEVLRVEEQPYDPSGADAWAAGVVLLEMLCGFGKLNFLMDWPRDTPPCKRRGDELIAYFASPEEFCYSLVDDLQEEATRELLDVFCGIFQASLETRWSADDILGSAWLDHDRRSPSTLVGTPFEFE